jgi:hypothetical protein
MRLWTLHPRYLDARGLVALWREALLARKVLAGQTRGYRHHPQLERFRQVGDPLAAVDSYLAEVCAEAARRGYRFDATKIGAARLADKLEATSGQLAYEWSHLRAKLALRDPAKLAECAGTDMPQAHPLFRVVAGGVASWERI